MASRLQDYLLRRGDNIGDPEVLNARFRDIDLRLAQQESVQKTWDEALTAIQQLGLEKINEVLLPAYLKIQELSQLGVIFTGHSATEIEISTGLKRLIIDESERDRFAPAAFVAAFVEDDLGKAILGTVQDYNRLTGELTVYVHRVSGEGSAGAGWIIHAASDTDNAEAAGLALLYKQSAEAARDTALSASSVATAARDDTLAAKTIANGYRDETIAARNTTVDAKDTVLANLASLDQYYLGAHATDPTGDNQGGPLQLGMQYFNTTAKEMRVWKGVGDGWAAEYLPGGSSVDSFNGRTGAVGSADGDYNAAQIVVTPTGGITANRVQAALQGLDTAKADKSTTLAGYGITNAYTKTEVDTALAGKANAATTLAGYGITNAYTKTEVDTALAGKQAALGFTPVDSAQLGAANGVATLGGDGKLATSQIPTALVGAVVYQGTWNAATNTPTLANGTGTKGHYYKVSVAGTTNINGNAQWNVGDVIIYNGATWDRLEGDSSEVTSVAGRTGAVTLGIADVSGLQTALDAKAPTASPALTGMPTAPTAAADTNTTQIATTAFVVGQAGTSSPAMNGTAAVGTSLKFARDDHVHPTDTSRVPTSRTISTAGLAAGGGNLSTDRTINVAIASVSDYRGKTQNAAALTPKQVWDAMAEVTLTDGATITPDFSAGIDFTVTLGGNRTLANPANIVVGQRGRIRIVQDATGSRTLAFGSYYKWAGGTAGTLSTAANAVDYLDYDVRAATEIRVSLSKAWA